MSSRQPKTVGAVAGSLVGLWLLLSIPGAEPPVAPAPERGRGFAWNLDTLWRSLETTYAHTRLAGCGTADRAAAGGLSGLAATAEQLLRSPVPPPAPRPWIRSSAGSLRWRRSSPRVRANLRDYVRLSGRLREAIKWQSGQGPVPQGMSPGAALRSSAFSGRQRWVAARVTEAAARWTRRQGYPPPYWVLLDLARTATEALREARPSAQL